MSQEKVVQLPQKRILSAKDILDVDDLETLDVDVPEWGGIARLRVLNGEQLLQFFAKQKEMSNLQSSMLLLAMSLIDENGTPLYTEDQIAQISKKSFKVITRLAKKAMELNALSEDKEEAKAQEEKVKNVSGEGVQDASPTPSPVS
jgi:hypothetical protein